MAEYTADKLQIDIGANTSKAVQQINALASALNKMKQTASTKKTKVSVDSKDVDKAAKRVSGLANLLNSLKRIAMYRMVRSAIRGITDAFKTGVSNLYEYSRIVGTDFKAAMDSMATSALYAKNSLGAMVAPIIQMLAPAVDWLTGKFVALINVINQLFAVLGGKSSYTKAIKQATEYSKATDKAAASAKRFLLGIDEINMMNLGGGGGSAAQDFSKMFEEADVEDTWLNKFAKSVNDDFNKIKTVIQKNLTDIELMLGGFMLGMGAVLAFSGANIPLGIGMMAAGAALIYKTAKEKWGSLGGLIEGDISYIQTIVGGALLGVGAILAFSGINIPLGIAMMAAGAVVAVSGALNWSGLSDKVKETLALISGAVSIALLAVGAVLAFSGANIPLGIAMMAGGAIGLASLGLNWDKVPDKIKGVLATIEAAVGVAFLALGAILAFSGVNIPLGLGLMATGVAFEAMAKANWGLIPDKVKKTLIDITVAAGLSLLAIGAVLAFSGVATPLGIAMMAAGGISLVSAVGLNWNSISTSVSKAWDNLIQVVRQKFAELKAWWNGQTLEAPRISDYKNNGISVGSGRAFATGGFPQRGEVFLAREAGAEMVGSIGGHTAVANNDQIVEGISEGVRDANTEVLTAIIRGVSQIVGAIREGGSSGGVDIDMLASALYQPMQRQGQIHGNNLVAFTR